MVWLAGIDLLESNKRCDDRPVIGLNSEVLQLDHNRMVIALLQELVHATPNIIAETEALYVGAINEMRMLRDLDP